MSPDREIPNSNGGRGGTDDQRRFGNLLIEARLQETFASHRAGAAPSDAIWESIRQRARAASPRTGVVSLRSKIIAGTALLTVAATIAAVIFVGRAREHASEPGPASGGESVVTGSGLTPTDERLLEMTRVDIDLAHRLNLEGMASVELLLAAPADSASLKQEVRRAREATDAALATWQQEVAGDPLGRPIEGHEDPQRNAIERLKSVTTTNRRSVDDGNAAPDIVADQLLQGSKAATDVSLTSAYRAETPAAALTLLAASNLASLESSFSYTQSVLAVATRPTAGPGSPQMSPQQAAAKLDQLPDDRQAYLYAASVLLVGDQKRSIEALGSSPPFAEQSQLISTLTDRGAPSPRVSELMDRGRQGVQDIDAVTLGVIGSPRVAPRTLPTEEIEKAAAPTRDLTYQIRREGLLAAAASTPVARESDLASQERSTDSALAAWRRATGVATLNPIRAALDRTSGSLDSLAGVRSLAGNGDPLRTAAGYESLFGPLGELTTELVLLVPRASAILPALAESFAIRADDGLAIEATTGIAAVASPASPGRYPHDTVSPYRELAAAADAASVDVNLFETAASAAMKPVFRDLHATPAFSQDSEELFKFLSAGLPGDQAGITQQRWLTDSLALLDGLEQTVAKLREAG